MARVSDEALDSLEYLIILAMGAAGFVVTIAPPSREGNLSWWLALAGFSALCVFGVLVHRKQGQRTAAAKTTLEQRLAEIGNEQRETHLVVVDIRSRLGALIGPVLVPVSASATASWEALTGVGTAGKVGTMGVEITVTKKGVGEKEEVEKIFLAAPLLSAGKESALREALSKVSGKVSFIAAEGAVQEMDHLAKVFRESKWDVATMRVARFKEPVVDIIVQAASEDAAYAGFVQDAMRGVGIDAMGAIVPSLPRDQVEIVVGNTTAKPAKLEHRLLALAKEITEFVDEQRRLPSRSGLETNQIFRKRLESRIGRMGKELEQSGHKDEEISNYFGWTSGEEFEAAAELTDFEEIASQLREAAERIARKQIKPLVSGTEEPPHEGA